MSDIYGSQRSAHGDQQQSSFTTGAERPDDDTPVTCVEIYCPKMT